MFLLIRACNLIFCNMLLPLHSIMFLLIHGHKIFRMVGTSFTFHNVSINTKIWQRSCSDWNPLHSIMFLLIRRRPEAGNWSCKTLHSIMFLLIHLNCFALNRLVSSFTFHNVSINTQRHLPRVQSQLLYIP